MKTTYNTIKSIRGEGKGWFGSISKVVIKRTCRYVFLRSTSISLLIPKESFHLTFSYEVLFGLFLM